MYRRTLKKPTSAGMDPKMTVPPKKKPRKKPNPYRAPVTVKRYYKGIEYGIKVLRDDLLSQVEDEELKKLIAKRAGLMIGVSNKKLTDLEKKKTKEKLLEWEEKEWERI